MVAFLIFWPCDPCQTFQLRSGEICVTSMSRGKKFSWVNASLFPVESHKNVEVGVTWSSRGGGSHEPTPEAGVVPRNTSPGTSHVGVELRTRASSSKLLRELVSHLARSQGPIYLKHDDIVNITKPMFWDLSGLIWDLIDRLTGWKIQFEKFRDWQIDSMTD